MILGENNLIKIIKKTLKTKKQTKIDMAIHLIINLLLFCLNLVFLIGYHVLTVSFIFKAFIQYLKNHMKKEEKNIKEEFIDTNQK